MPRERPAPEPFEPTWLDRSLNRYLVWGIVFMVVLVAGFAVYRAREPSLRADASREQELSYRRLGRQLFASNCASCHGRNGVGSDGPTLNAREFLKSATDEQIHHVVAAGISGTEMPAWSIDFGGALTDEQVRQIVTYMRSWQPDAPSVPDWREGTPAEADHEDEEGDDHEQVDAQIVQDAGTISP